MGRGDLELVVPVLHVQLLDAEPRPLGRLGQVDEAARSSELREPVRRPALARRVLAAGASRVHSSWRRPGPSGPRFWAIATTRRRTARPHIGDGGPSWVHRSPGAQPTPSATTRRSAGRCGSAGLRPRRARGERDRAVGGEDAPGRRGAHADPVEGVEPARGDVLGPGDPAMSTTEPPTRTRPAGESVPIVRTGRCRAGMARPAVLNARLNETTAGDASESTPRLSFLHRVHHEEVAVHLVALRGAAPERLRPAVVAAHERVARQVGTLRARARVERG